MRNLVWSNVGQGFEIPKEEEEEESVYDLEEYICDVWSRRMQPTPFNYFSSYASSAGLSFLFTIDGLSGV
jgi:hypothetical protein